MEIGVITLSGKGLKMACELHDIAENSVYVVRDESDFSFMLRDCKKSKIKLLWAEDLDSAFRLSHWRWHQMIAEHNKSFEDDKD
jgi:hypothetical protein